MSCVLMCSMLLFYVAWVAFVACSCNLKEH